VTHTINDTQHNKTVIMLGVAFFIAMLNVIMLIVVILNVVMSIGTMLNANPRTSFPQF
jgi:hypothetical protein